ncbi:HD domain-containing phosphohydrolase [Desulfosediminicola flagellatus]|uniref:HD domain-containing phosphohydrolase n=1 Tax=Desulfosediminicola flagellatus TaxID=2569541 RepID=UPI0010AB55BE|nr:HD domain-containing phosphohydrolase [Desulfosediminicola flagellatus]
MTEKVIFVDDEDHILQSMKRQLRKRFEVFTALGGREALEIMKENGPFAVIVSDMRMPAMDGIQLLSEVKTLYPDTVRMMLTGNADQETAIEAVNKGQIFRFLNKPCPTSTLVTSIALAQRQYRLINAEREVLDKTLKGSIKVLSELLSLANPVAFSSGYRIKGLVSELAKILEFREPWQLEIAALMSQIGCITLPAEILNKLYVGQPLDDEEKEMYRSHPKIGADLLRHIPRLKTVSGIIALQLMTMDELNQKCETDEDITEEMAIGAQVLKISIDYDMLIYGGATHKEAVKSLKGRKIYNPDILEHMAGIKLVSEQRKIVSVDVKDIAIGMVAEQNIIAKNGALITPKGQEVTWPVLQGLKNFAKQVGVQEPIRVRLSA